MKRLLPLLFSLTLIPQLSAAATPPAHVVMAYGLMPEPGNPAFRLTTQQAKQLSHLNMAFLTLNAQGECVTETPLSKKDLQAQQTAWQAARRDNPSLRILLSVGGWAHSNDDSKEAAFFRNAAASEEGRRRFAQSCMRMVRQFGLQGLDIDWEYPRPEDSLNFAKLLRAVRTEMERQPAKNMPSYQITIAVPGSAFGLSRIYTHLRDIAQQADYLQLMTYDLHGPWDQQTHHQAHLFAEKDEALFHHPLRALAPASLSAADKDRLYPPMFAMTIDAAVQQYLTGGVPAHKLVMGIPFYGRAFYQTGSANQGLFQPFVTQAGDHYTGPKDLLPGCVSCERSGDPRIPDYADLVSLLRSKQGYQALFSDASQASWIWHPERRVFITYDSARVVQRKMRYIREHGLAGAMAWQLGGDHPQESLLQVMSEGLSQKAYP